MWMPGTPALLTQGSGRAGEAAAGGNRSNYAMQTLGAARRDASPTRRAPAPPSRAEQALVTGAGSADARPKQAVADAQAQARGAGRGGGPGRRSRRAVARRPPAAPADITTVQRVDGVDSAVDHRRRRRSTSFCSAPSPHEVRRHQGARREGRGLTPARSPTPRSPINIDNTYEVVSTQLSKNVVGMVEGIDPKLKDTYVMFGAHLDHVGYRTARRPAGRGGGGRGSAGAAQPAARSHLQRRRRRRVGIDGACWGSPRRSRPDRSRSGRSSSSGTPARKSGLLGSRYMADFPVVPLEKVQAQFNIDMIGRNRDDDPAQANTVFVIGADRISTDLHNLVVDTNRTLAKPLTLDYEYNDPADPNSFYTRSDHYSYAAKGIPIAFFFTGTHPDYHGAGDHGGQDPVSRS